MKKLLIAIILTSLIGACCKKSNNDVKPNTTANTTGTTINDDTVTYTIQGRLLDGKTLQPFQGADIWIGRKAYSPKNSKPSFYKIITVYGDGKFKFTYKGKDALDDYLLSPNSGFSEWPNSQPDTIVPSRKNINIDLYFSQEAYCDIILRPKKGNDTVSHFWLYGVYEDFTEGNNDKIIKIERHYDGLYKTIHSKSNNGISLSVGYTKDEAINNIKYFTSRKSLAYRGLPYRDSIIVLY